MENLNVFKVISNFINDLGDLFSDQHSLKLYKRFMQKTTFSHEQTINKNIELFRVFCVANRSSIESKDEKKLEQKKIEYSDKIFIDFSQIFSKADKESRDAIWQYLLTISAYLDPSSNAKKLLKQMSEESKKKGQSGNEENFLTNIIEKVEKSIDVKSASENPTAAIAGILSSGVFTDLIGNMQNGIESGSLDINKLMGVVQGMMSTLSTDGSGGPSAGGNPMDMLKMLNPSK